MRSCAARRGSGSPTVRARHSERRRTVEGFRETSDRLSALGVSLQEQAEALGLAYQTIRLMRLEPDAKGYRNPPPRSNWSSAWGRLLRERAERMLREADRLEGAAH